MQTLGLLVYRAIRETAQKVSASPDLSESEPGTSPIVVDAI